MRYLTLAEVVYLHDAIIEATGGARGLREPGGLASALAQPRATFGGDDLHASLIDKAAALGFALVRSHAFVDGNKRIAHAAMETFLLLNGAEIAAPIDEQERIMLALAEGAYSRDELARWLEEHTRPSQE